MNRLLRLLFVGAVVSLAVFLSATAVSATAVSLISAGEAETEVSLLTSRGGTDAPVSLGLAVLAGETDMVVSTRRGELYYFTPEDFLRAMNRSAFESLTVTEAPDASVGTLYLGESVVQSGQEISFANVGRLSYASATEECSVGAFGFSLDRTGYSVSCRVYGTEEAGEAPTVAHVPASRLSNGTHADLSCVGVLSGYDPDGDGLVYEIVSGAEHGAVRMLDREAGSYLYTPYAGYTGEDSFRYVVRDAEGKYSESREVRVTVAEPTVSVSFTDLDGDGAVNAALSVTEHGVMSGTEVGGETFFYPGRSVSRADFLAMAMRAVGIGEEGGAPTVFRDCEAIPASLRGYVAKAYAIGAVNGVFRDGGLSFEPDRAITRAEAVKVLSALIDASEAIPTVWKSASEEAVTAATVDASAIPAFAKDAAYRLSALGVYPASSVSDAPSAPLTRLEVAEMLSMLLLAREG